MASSNKSSGVLLKFLRSREEKVEVVMALYYAYQAVLRRKRRRFINRKVLSAMCIDPSSLILKEITRNQVFTKDLPIEEFCRLTRVLLHYFLSQLCHQTVLTSKKICKKGLYEHFKRQRQVLKHLKDEIRQARFHRQA